MANVSNNQRSARTPWQVTRSVWYAMFMREAISRTMSDRMGWFWMIFEPVAMIAIMVGVRSFIGVKLVINAEFIPWIRGELLRAVALCAAAKCSAE